MENSNGLPSLVSPILEPSISILPPRTAEQPPSLDRTSIPPNTGNIPVSTLSRSGSQATRSTGHPVSRVRADWIPFTLRWYFLLLPVVASLCFSIVLAYLCWYSHSRHGLGGDDGSSGILFGWRFTPTLLAVLYTQITVILFEDIKRTEPFARLATASSGGASAYGTLLQTPKAWWTVFFDLVFRRKEMGKTGWSLICSTVLNMLALLAISPLSSALLTSEEVALSKPFDFHRLAPMNETALSINATRETYFRTMAALTRNISTSAWVSDTSLTFPFWPSTEGAQLGPEISSSHGSWQVETITYNASLMCQNMTVEKAQMQDRAYEAPDWHGFMYNGTQPMVSYVLVSEDGCRYELDVHPAVDLAYNGGVMWSDASTFHPIEPQGTLGVDALMINANVSAKSPYARVKSSNECKNREILIMSTPWSVPRPLSTLSSLRLNSSSYEKSADFRMRALLCDSQYTQTRAPIVASMTPGVHTTLESAAGIIGKTENLSTALVDLPAFQKLSLGDQWRLYVDSSSMATDATRSDDKSAQEDDEIVPQIPGFSGPGVILGALSDFDLKSVLDDPRLEVRIETIRGRFFAEALWDLLSGSGPIQHENMQGLAVVSEERIIVLQEIGITLSSLFFVSFLLFVALIWFSRLRRRPLHLQSDPSSAVGLGVLLNPERTTMSTIKQMHNAPRNDMYTALRQERFFTSDYTLLESASGTVAGLLPKTKTKTARSNWLPRAIHLWSLFALGLFLSLILAAVLVLNEYGAGSRLYQQAFTYQADLSKYGLSVSSFAPISIAPTVISIATTLWWDQVDMTFRILQPYIAMTHEPTPIRNGAGLTYRSKTWFGAAVKAAKNKHWLLFMVAIGSTLCQVLTVSMSALFERRSDNHIQQLSINRTLQMRHYPVITEIKTEPSYARYHAELVLDKMYLNASSNWLHSAAIQVSMNGSRPQWTYEEWSFVPVDFAQISESSIQSTLNAETNIAAFSRTNVTITTPAIRATLNCAPVPEIANISSWFSQDEVMDPDGAFDATGVKNMSALRRFIFEDSPAYTTTFTDANRIQCCTNGSNKDPGRSIIGYWSPTDSLDFPYAGRTWPLSIVPKWIVGKPRSVSLGATGMVYDLVYEETPSLQAALCTPIIEVAEATISVDRATKMVHSYALNGPPLAYDPAWSEVFIRHELSDTKKRYNNRNYTGSLNVTTSFGILFLDAMFGAADRGTGMLENRQMNEKLNDNAFNIRDQDFGLNMDLMTYSMYTLGRKDPEALLNYTTLTNHANRTLQTFFQHFVAHGLSTTGGGWVYQKVDDRSMEALGRAVDANGTIIPDYVYPVVNTDRAIMATVSNRIQVLYMNPVATYLSTAILIWLIGTVVVIVCLQRKYTSSMFRNVELIADVLVLVAGSENFLKLAQREGVMLKKDGDIKTKLGWFKGRDGSVRWGIEVVGGQNAVEWVDAPKQ